MITFKEILTEGFMMSLNPLTKIEAKFLNYFNKIYLGRREDDLEKMKQELEEKGFNDAKSIILLNLYLNNEFKIYKAGRKVIREISWIPSYSRLNNFKFSDLLNYTSSNYENINNVDVIGRFLHRFSGFFYGDILKNLLLTKDNNYLYKLYKYFDDTSKDNIQTTISLVLFYRYIKDDDFSPKLAKQMQFMPKQGKIVLTTDQVASFFVSNEEYYQGLIKKALDGDYSWEDIWSDVDELNEYMWGEISDENKKFIATLVYNATPFFPDEDDEIYIKIKNKSLSDDDLYELIDENDDYSDIKYQIELAHTQAEGDGDFSYILEEVKSEITDFFGPFEFDADNNLIIDFNLNKISKEHLLQVLDYDTFPQTLEDFLMESKEFLPNRNLPSINTQSFYHGNHPGNMDEVYFNDVLSDNLENL